MSGLFDALKFLSPAAAIGGGGGGGALNALAGSGLFGALGALLHHGGGGGGKGPTAPPDVIQQGPTVAAPNVPPPVMTAPPVVPPPSLNAAPPPGIAVANEANPLMNGKGNMLTSPGDVGAMTGRPDLQRHGLLGHLRDYLDQPGVSAALFRSGAETMQNGLGAGLAKGAEYMDQRGKDEAATAGEHEKTLLERLKANNAHDLGLGNLAVNEGQLVESGRHNRVGEGNDAYRVDASLHNHATPSGDALVGANTSAANNVRDNGTRVETAGMTQAGENGRNAASNTNALTIAGMPARPQAPKNEHKEVIHHTGVHSIADDAGYNALPSGAQFMGPDGVVRIKP